jgi:predicted DCC family thiol-disulfide oxidoreductase YuxK
LVDARHTLFYDGTCGLCDRFVQRVLARDTEDRFRFAPLQGAYASRVLGAHGVTLAPEQPLDTVYVLTADGRLLDRSDAALFVAEQLPGRHGLARVAGRLPRALRDLGYRMVARSRYRLFGRRDACAVPTPETRAKFLEDPTG